MININILNLLQRSKTNLKDWITLRELHQFYRLVTLFSGVTVLQSSLKLLNTRIASLVKTNGFTFTFQYLKESLRLTIRALSGSPEKSKDSIPRVSVDRYGYPTFIPLLLRKALYAPSSNMKEVRAILCLLSVFRTFKVTTVPDLSTIIGAFTGTARSIDKTILTVALKELRFRVKFGMMSGFISQSAGPNSKYATWGAGLDALAFFHHPKQMYSFIRLCWITKSYFYLIWFLMILFGGPGFVYLSMVKLRLLTPLVLGRLSVVHDQAGKARIVAITNWWLQLGLKPLHDSIFKNLKTIPMDGTFDQGKPLLELYYNRDRDHKFSCFDLSAATDRLPLELQIDILKLLGVEGDLWRDLLDIPWHLSSEIKGDSPIKYEVGQPMGAYSSWGMLAVTHHVIVKAASARAGISNFTKYAILGDDIVINNDKVAHEYLLLMNILGVGINQAKSIISSDTIEFAKRWIIPWGEISPLGPGNILSVMRHPYSLGNLVMEAVQKGYFSNKDQIVNLFNSIPEFIQKQSVFAIWTVFGLSGVLRPRGQLDRILLSWSSFEGEIDPMYLRYTYPMGLFQVLLDEYREHAEKVRRQEILFLKQSYKITGVRFKALRFIELLLLYFSPGFWLYWHGFIRADIDAQDMFLKLSEFGKRGSETVREINELVELTPSINPAFIDWGRIDKRRAAKDYSVFLRKVEHAVFKIYKQQMDNRRS